MAEPFKVQPLPLRQQLDQRLSNMKQERNSYEAHWREISDYIIPRRGQWVANDNNRGSKKNGKILDSSGIYAHRTLSAGLMSGITSPARPWFRISVEDRQLLDDRSVRNWLYDVQELIRAIFSSSNLYQALPVVYDELGAFGTGAIIILPDYDEVIRAYPFTVGEYWIANDKRLQVRTFYREYTLTAWQLYEEFDWDSLSDAAQQSLRSNRYQDRFEVIHAIEKNMERDLTRDDSKNKAWRSVHYEKAAKGNNLLRESGYDIFPVLSPRWHLIGTNVYGRSPGMDGLPDVKQLQAMSKTKGQAIAKMVSPPMVGPGTLRNTGSSVLPGDMTYIDSFQQNGMKFEPAYQVDPKVRELVMDIQDIRNQVSRAFYEDLFLMLAQSDRRQITATEVAERHEEKLLQLGPVLERLDNELFNPLIDLTFHYMEEAQIIPTPPPVLQGAPLKIEYISLLHTAQQIATINAAERFLGIVGSISSVTPDVLDVVDFDEAVESIGDMMNVPSKWIKDKRTIAQQRNERNRQIQMQQASENLPNITQGAKTLSETEPTGQDILGSILGTR